MKIRTAQGYTGMQDHIESEQGAHVATIHESVPKEDRESLAAEIVRRWNAIESNLIGAK